MRSAELEQKIRENSFRISKLSELLNSLKEENEDLRKQLENNHNGNAPENAIEYTETRISQSHKMLSDELYNYINRKLEERDQRLEEYKNFKKAEDWMLTFGFDNMLSQLQLYEIEQRFPGNRSKIESFQNSHVGEKCFVIGNGPSLNAEDLTTLKDNHIFCLASKGIYNIFDDTPWRPDIWGVSDLDYIKLKEIDINKLSGFPKFVCAQAILRHNIEIKDAIYYPFIQAERQPCFFNKDITRGIHFYGTITGKLINIAVYMGFTEIYLLGCDHTLPMKIDENGKKVVDTSVNSHFNNKYFSNEQERSQVYKNVIDAEKSFQYTTQAYADIKYHCEKQLGVQIYNASRKSALEVFPRINFDEVIR